MRIGICVVVFALISCSKKEPTPAGPGSSPAPPVAPTKAAPNITPELLFKEGPTAFIDTHRGVLLAVDDKIEHLCRAQLGMQLVRLGKIAEAAQAANTTTCTPQGRYGTCTFRNAAGEPTNPDSTATWVFVGDDANAPVLLAVLLGSAATRVDALESELAQERKCKRPSED